MLISFVVLSALHLSVVVFMPENRLGVLLTKGGPILLLIYFLYKKIGINTHLKKFILIGLLFSICGDYLLIFPELFIFGLVSFLIAHIFYITAFSKGSSFSIEKSIPFYIIGGTLFFILRPGLKELEIPVLIYVLTISTMVWRSFARNNANKSSFYAGFIGACIFFVSDSLIGIGKFKMPIPADRILIMFTYFLGQYLIFRSAEKE